MRTTIYRTFTPALLALIAPLMFVACSDDAGSNDANGNAATNKAANNMSSNNNQGGETDKTTFDVEAKDNTSGMTTREENEIEDKNASQANSGASIAGSILSIYLVAPSGSTISAVVETTEELRAPGSFTVTVPPDATFVTWLNPLAGQTLESSSGTITLENCPKVAGDKIKGSFDNVQLVNLFDDSTQTLNGSFDIALYAVSGSLFCTEAPVTNEDMGGGMNDRDMGGGMNDRDMGGGQTCDATICDDPNSNCCPYAQCMATCEFNCLTQDPACSDPFNADPVKCGQCLEACLDSCNVSQECRSAYVELSTCESNAGCDEASDEDAELECSKQNCCAELKATF